MIAGAKFSHVNVIARDWRALAKFYADVFGCERVGAERDLSGEALQRGTKVAQAELRGVHLRLPGDSSGPTIEIFSYDPAEDSPASGPNRRGFRHIAFLVPDVTAAREAVLRAGGADHGEMATTAAGDGSFLTWIYMRDPEGNLFELQASDE
jgi:catechol 2,3-dioxygenase-like lactoylglutathione lyase family enzyme